MNNEEGRVCVILGGGGHARVLIDTLQQYTKIRIAGILDPNRTLWGQSMLDVPVLGGDDLLPELVRKDVNCFVIGMGSIGNFQLRQKLYQTAIALGIEVVSVIHRTATISRWAQVGQGLQMMPYSVINAGAVVGNNVIINTGAIVEHDCVLDDFVHVATGAQLASTVRLGKGAHIGAGAAVRQCLTIGEGAIVGIGAAVVEDVNPYTTVVGVPAKPIRRV